MSDADFWDLTWRDWGGWIGRIQNIQKIRNQDRELSMELTRQFMCLFANANRDPKKPAIKATDFWVLSYDTQIEEREKEDYDVIMKQIEQGFKRRGKKKE